MNITLLTDAVCSPTALLNFHRIPWQIIIDYDISKYEALFPLLRACSFSYKQQADGRKHLGFIAQDVDDVRNSLGIPVNDLAAVGQPDEHIDYYRIAYNEFVPLLVHMLQKLYARVEKLEAKIKETETDVNG